MKNKSSWPAPNWSILCRHSKAKNIAALAFLGSLIFFVPKFLGNNLSKEIIVNHVGIILALDMAVIFISTFLIKMLCPDEIFSSYDFRHFKEKQSHLFSENFEENRKTIHELTGVRIMLDPPSKEYSLKCYYDYLDKVKLEKTRVALALIFYASVAFYFLIVFINFIKFISSIILSN